MVFIESPSCDFSEVSKISNLEKKERGPFVAEYVSAAEGCREIICLKWLMEEIGVESLIEHPTTLWIDNQSAKKVAENHIIADASKSIDIANHIVREYVEKEEIQL